MKLTIIDRTIGPAGVLFGVIRAVNSDMPRFYSVLIGALAVSFQCSSIFGLFGTPLSKLIVENLSIQISVQSQDKFDLALRFLLSLVLVIIGERTLIDCFQRAHVKVGKIESHSAFIIFYVTAITVINQFFDIKFGISIAASCNLLLLVASSFLYRINGARAN